jgi:hypothetical protein
MILPVITSVIMPEQLLLMLFRLFLESMVGSLFLYTR